ncbi:hypothetical protein DsansV1_C08g0083241 [Dioscorea sansibarensis]
MSCYFLCIMSMLSNVILKLLLTEQLFIYLIQTDQEINNLVFEFFGMEDMKSKVPTLGLHILHLYRTGLIRPNGFNLDVVFRSDAYHGDPMPTASELHESGVMFMASSMNKTNDISFEYGILKIPSLMIDDSTESTFLNLLAFEHLHSDNQVEVTYVVCFLDELIHSVKDVHLLCSHGIISNAVGSDQAAFDLIKRLTKEVVLLNPIREVTLVERELKGYTKRRHVRVIRLLRRWFSILMNVYFNNPWSTITVIAAAVALVLTFIQTYYAILGYKYPMNNV